MLGEFSNVVLSLNEHAKLRSRFGPQVTEEYIEKLSCWRAVNPRKAKGSCDYARLIIWIKKDATIQAFTPPPSPAPPLLDELEIQHRAACLQRVRIREGLTPNDIESCLRAIRELDGERGL